MRSDTVTGRLHLEDFLLYVGRHFSLELTKRDASLSLVEELGLDSLQMMELLVLITDLGVEVSEEAASELETIADWYGYYRSQSD